MLDPVVKEDVVKLANEFAKNFESKRILITGGAGFLGSWLADVLHQCGAEVMVLDNLSTGKLEFIDHLLQSDRFRFIRGDVARGLPEADVDIIIHTASRASPDDFMQHPVETAVTNGVGTYNVLEYARKKDVPVLFTSTSEVYGDAEVIPTPEDYWGKVNPIGPRSCYDEGKRFSEALAIAYYREYGLDVRIARIFNSYGPRLRGDGAYGRVVSRFIMLALSGKPLTIHGDGKQTRSFTYVSDTIRGLLLMLVKDVKGEVINIGNNKETTILELAKLIIKLVGRDVGMVFLPPREDDPRRRCPEITKAKKLLGWEPTVSLEEGLKKTIKWYLKYLSESKVT